MIDETKLLEFLKGAREHNRTAHDETGNNPTGEKDPYWLGRLAMCNTLIGWVEADIFEAEEE